MSEELPPPPPPPKRINLQEFRNCDLVSRLLAATPPYLYSAPVGPNNFFFSEMLRSLVQAKNNEQCTRNAATISSHLGRRPRKRSWSQHRSMFEQPVKPEEKLTVHEKPLELTNKVPYSISPKYQKSESPKVLSPNDNSMPSPPSRMTHHQLDIKPDYTTPVHSPSTQTHTATATEATSTVTAPVPASQSDLVLPPPPPMWYPPLYPPYGIDPLHFFIDLRVSGHIYDRKKENISPSAAATDNNNSTETVDSIGKHRHGSAFSVPAPRSGVADKSMIAALNLTSSDKQLPTDYSYFDYNDRAAGHKNTNYVMQNLPRIFTTGDDKTLSPRSEETDSKSDCEVDIKDVDQLEGLHNMSDEVVVVDGGRSDDELMIGA